MALFATDAAVQPASTNLLEFGAGKMFMKGKVVHPDPRKGLIFIHQTEDGLMHFCWKDSKSGVVEDDLIIFPEDAELKPVKQCKNGRVYLLTFKNNQQRKLFYWMQALKPDKDDEHVKKANEFFNNPPVPGSSGATAGTARGALNSRGLGQHDAADMSMVSQLLGLGSRSGATGEDIQNALSGVDRRQMMQFLNMMGVNGGVAGLSDLIGGVDATSTSASAKATNTQNQRSAVSATIPSSTTVSSNLASSQPSNAAGQSLANLGLTQSKTFVKAEDFSKILSSLGMSPAASLTAPNDVELQDVLTSKNVEPILIDDKSDSNVNRLINHLPKEDPITADRAEIVSTLRSPQFRQAVETFDAALKSGQLGSCMRHFGFSSDVVQAVDKGDIQSVAEILQNESKSSVATKSTSDETNESPSDARKKNGQKDDSIKKTKSDEMELD